MANAAMSAANAAHPAAVRAKADATNANDPQKLRYAAAHVLTVIALAGRKLTNGYKRQSQIKPPLPEKQMDHRTCLRLGILKGNKCSSTNVRI